MCFLYLIKFTLPYMGEGGCRRLFEYYKKGSRLKIGWETLLYSFQNLRKYSQHFV